VLIAHRYVSELPLALAAVTPSSVPTSNATTLEMMSQSVRLSCVITVVLRSYHPTKTAFLLMHSTVARCLESHSHPGFRAPISFFQHACRTFETSVERIAVLLGFPNMHKILSWHCNSRRVSGTCGTARRCQCGCFIIYLDVKLVH